MSKNCIKCREVIIRKNKGEVKGNLCRKCYENPKSKYKYQLSRIK